LHRLPQPHLIKDTTPKKQWKNITFYNKNKQKSESVKEWEKNKQIKLLFEHKWSVCTGNTQIYFMNIMLTSLPCSV
jgi:hypothetical protein